MIRPDDELLDFDRLLSTLCDSELTPVQLARLNRLLASEPDLQRRYVLYMGIHATLQYTIGEDLSLGPDGDSRPADLPGLYRERAEGMLPKVAPPGRRWRFRQVAAAILLLAGLACWAAWRDHRPAPAGSRPRGPVGRDE
jgi:hypothetical protein